MTPALTPEAMRQADRRTIQEFGIPEFTLMETAGRAAVAAMRAALPDPEHQIFGILCGRGNNGGDGLVMARVLHEQGCRSLVLLAEGPDRLSENAALNLALLDKLQIERVETASELGACTVLVDAMLGTGIESAPRAPYEGLIEWINGQTAFKVAVDLPSGLHGGTGQTLGKAVRADLTVALGALKTGLFLQDGPGTSGKVVSVSIGIPEFLIRSEAEAPGCALVSSDEFLRRHLPTVHRADTKFTTGPAIVIGGSPKYPGAPSLAARAAARVGSGYVVKSLRAGAPLMGDSEIPVISQSLEADLGPAIDRAKAILIGPGLGHESEQVRLVDEVLDRARCPVVIDADGLRALVELNRLPTKGNWTLTPHAAEFIGLTGKQAGPIEPVRMAQEWADRWNVTLVLKGMPSIVASPSESPVIVSTGNPALGTAGTGDVLAGLCVGLLAMGLDCYTAAVCATHLGGAASDRYVEHRGRASMMASDLIRQIPLLLSERFEH